MPHMIDRPIQTLKCEIGIMGVSMTVFRWWSHTMTEEAERLEEARLAARDKQQVIRRRQARTQQSNVQQYQHRRVRSSGGSGAAAPVGSDTATPRQNKGSVSVTNTNNSNGNGYHSIAIDHISSDNIRHDDYYDHNNASPMANDTTPNLVDLPSFDDVSRTSVTPLLPPAPSSTSSSSRNSRRSRESRRSRRQRRSSSDDDGDQATE
jgi:hypothetical protein